MKMRRDRHQAAPCPFSLSCCVRVRVRACARVSLLSLSLYLNLSISLAIYIYIYIIHIHHLSLVYVIDCRQYQPCCIGFLAVTRCQGLTHPILDSADSLDCIALALVEQSKIQVKTSENFLWKHKYHWPSKPTSTNYCSYCSNLLLCWSNFTESSQSSLCIHTESSWNFHFLTQSDD